MQAMIDELAKQAAESLGPVSYTHLDVYKRQTITSVLRKCARKIASGEVESVAVTAAMLEELLGPRIVKPDVYKRQGRRSRHRRRFPVQNRAFPAPHGW